MDGSYGVIIRIYFYAEPKDVSVVPKREADEHSIEAKWLSLEEFAQMQYIRSTDLLEFGKYIDEGGAIPTMSFFEEIWQLLHFGTDPS